MILAIHQPEHLPWLGFFHKASSADELLLLDHVQFRKDYFHNRNRIKGAAGATWITVPVLTQGLGPQPLDRVEIAAANNPRWRERHRRSVEQRYRRAPYFDAHAPALFALYERAWSRLLDLNIALLTWLFSALGIGTPVLRSSALSPSGSREDMLMDLCRKRGAKVYLSGISGRGYLTPARWSEAGIELRFQEFHHPVYPQRYGGFLPCMSAVDLLFNCGPASLDAIHGSGFPVLDHLFE